MKKFTKTTIKKIASENGIDIGVFAIQKSRTKAGYESRTYHIDVCLPEDCGEYERVVTLYNATAQKLVDAITEGTGVKFQKAASLWRGVEYAYTSEDINSGDGLKLHATELAPEADAANAPQEGTDNKPEPAVGQPAPQETMTPEDRIDALFHELVPVEGKADTVAGEIVRAVCRIGYRYSNDGDYVGHGYGKETCNPAARYLMANAGENVAEIVRCLWAAGEECGILDDGSYGNWLSELVRAALVYLDEHPELKTAPNAVGYWDYRDPNEDVDEWDDEDEDEWGVA